MSVPVGTPRHEVSLSEELSILIDGRPAFFSVGPSIIRVGCSEITPEAMEHILGQWKERFGTRYEEIVIQDPSKGPQPQ